ncbi:hypothetical protein KAW08_05225 [bacterium]|nr:hypothetical protein [bacterium]
MDLKMIREKTLKYVESMRIKNEPYGCYRSCVSSSKPSLEASSFAAMTRHFYGDIKNITEKERKEWVDYLQSHQEDNGDFIDPLLVDSEMWKDEKWENYGQGHCTSMTIHGLFALEAKVQKPFKRVELFKDKDYTFSWLEKRNWQDTYHTGNEVVQALLILQYARDFHKDREAGEVINWFFDYLDKKQNPETGLWGEVGNNSAGINPQIQGVDRQIQGGTFHFIIRYLYAHRPINHKKKIIDNCLANQNKDGSFGYASACADIDSIYLLTRLSLLTSHRKKEIEISLKRAINWVISLQNDDGGFVGKREGTESSKMFSTWFRTASLALIAKRLPTSFVGKINWYYLNTLWVMDD